MSKSSTPVRSASNISINVNDEGVEVKSVLSVDKRDVMGNRNNKGEDIIKGLSLRVVFPGYACI